MSKPFQIVSDYTPAGDQPTAIKQLVAGLESGLLAQRVFVVQEQPRGTVAQGIGELAGRESCGYITATDIFFKALFD